jgi:hypothetical protein
MEELERQFVESDRENVLLNATFAEVNRLSDENAQLRVRIKELEGERELLRYLLTSKYEFIPQQTGEVLVWFLGKDPHLCATLDEAIAYAKEQHAALEER